MDNKITKERVSAHLSFDWPKYIGLFVAVVLFWTFIFMFSAPRENDFDTISVYSFAPYSSPQEFSDLQEDLDKAFGNTVRHVYAENYARDDVSTSNVIMTRSATMEFDIIIAQKTYFSAEELEEKAISGFTTYFVDVGMMYPLDQMLDDVLIHGALDMTEEKEASLRAFLKGKRNYRKTSALDAEIEETKKRWEELKVTAAYVQAFLEENPDAAFVYRKGTHRASYNFPTDHIEIDDVERIWGLDLSKFSSKITNLIADVETFEDLDVFKTFKFDCALGICAKVDAKKHIFYEQLEVLKYFIDNYYFDN